MFESLAERDAIEFFAVSVFVVHRPDGQVVFFCLGFGGIAVEFRRGSHVEPTVGANELVVVDFFEERSGGADFGEAGRSMRLVADDEIEIDISGGDGVERLVSREDDVEGVGADFVFDLGRLGSDGEFDFAKPIINGKEKYMRIAIRKRKNGDS